MLNRREKTRICWWLGLFFPFLLFSCQKNEKETANNTLFRLLPPEYTHINFANPIHENDTFNMIAFSYVYNGGGVGIGDINNDGLSDIYFTGNMTSGRLYINKGNLKFEDITEEAGVTTDGWSTGVTMADINQDGYLDIYICRSGNYEPSRRANLLFINNKDQTFTEQAKDYGLADEGYATQASFFDYDKDGDLDMYLLNSTNEDRNPNRIKPIINDGTGPASDKFYRNNGDGTFSEISKQVGILHNGWGLGIAISDINRDEWEDIYVSNDFLAHDYLYVNNQDGTFSEKGAQYLKHHSHFSMGNDLADFNNDGWIDIMVLDMLPPDNEHQKKMAGPVNYDQFQMILKAGYHPQYMRNTLQLNNGITESGAVSFSEIGQLTGVAATDWSWAPLFADYDNDGYKDLLVTNGYRRDITDMDFIVYNASLGGNREEADKKIIEKSTQLPSLKRTNFLYRNKGDLTFTEVSQPWGFTQPSYSNGVAYADLDNDGDLDVVISNIDEPAFIYENTANLYTPDHHFLKIRLQGKSPNVNGIGTQITLYYDGQQQFYHHAVSRGYQSSIEQDIHFGLGKYASVDSIIVNWPNLKVQKLMDIQTNQTIELNQTEAKSVNATRPKAVPLLQEVADKYGITYQHQEKHFNDFAQQPLLPHMLSQQGPKLAAGDVNGDGLEDFFVGGGTEYGGTIFYQTTKGTFSPVELPHGESYEDLGSLFFDADQDGDLDLYVVSGSNEHPLESEYYQDRLYINQGNNAKGHVRFELAKDALPDIRSSGSCVLAADFDHDGDLDLFVGGRLVPNYYPLPGLTYILRNDNGKFNDVTDEVAEGLKNIGMVTDAMWTDFDNDGQTDLIVVGEFMPILFYKNDKGKLRNITSQTGLENTSGWWNCIEGGDFDHDGDIDYVIGNLGKNSRYQATVEEPLTIYANDYDKNGSIDPIFTYFLEHEEYPVPSRDDFIRQITAAKRRFPTYADYANATIKDILAPADLDAAYVVKAANTKSCYIENLGNGKFNISALPIQAQFAPIQGFVCDDVDHDNKLDILAVGNAYTTGVPAGMYDASIGWLMKGDGKGNFTAMDLQTSGFYANGDCRDIIKIQAADKKLYLVSQNRSKLLVFEQNKK